MKSKGYLGLLKGKWVALVSAAIVIFILFVYAVFYAPVIKKLKSGLSICRSLDNEIATAHKTIYSLGKGGLNMVLITEQDASRAINELTEHGKQIGVDFDYIRPRDIIKGKNPEYKILPVEIGIDASYEKLGRFMGSLDELKKTLIRVKSLDMVPDEKDPQMLKTKLVLDIYLSSVTHEE